MDAEAIEKEGGEAHLKTADGILVPGGFGNRGTLGKMQAIQYARTHQVPFFGICFGMQIAALEFARNVCGLKDAESREFDRPSKNVVIDLMEEQKSISQKGGTMRLGSYACALKPKTLAKTLYKVSQIAERHRHRYEFNNTYRELFEKKGMVFSGIHEEKNLVEIMELPGHPWFLGCQFHPEFKSRPLAPHPLFSDFIRASLEKKINVAPKKSRTCTPLKKNLKISEQHAVA